MTLVSSKIQLSWNYNFRAASEALTSDPNTFCENPDLVATTPEYAWGAGIFFWMENLKEETTCHIEALKNHDFGGTLNNINGGLVSQPSPSFIAFLSFMYVLTALLIYRNALHTTGVGTVKQ